MTSVPVHRLIFYLCCSVLVTTVCSCKQRVFNTPVFLLRKFYSVEVSCHSVNTASQTKVFCPTFCFVRGTNSSWVNVFFFSLKGAGLQENNVTQFSKLPSASQGRALNLLASKSGRDSSRRMSWRKSHQTPSSCRVCVDSRKEELGMFSTACSGKTHKVPRKHYEGMSLFVPKRQSPTRGKKRVYSVGCSLVRGTLHGLVSSRDLINTRCFLEKDD